MPFSWPSMRRKHRFEAHWTDNHRILWFFKTWRNAFLEVAAIMDSFKISLPVSLLGALAMWMNMENEDGIVSYCIPSVNVYQNITWLISLMVVFHTSQAYARYMSGITLVYQMSAEFFDSISVLMSFTKTSKVGEKAKETFQNVVVRLYSLLLVSCLTGLRTIHEDSALDGSKISIIELEGLDPETLRHLEKAEKKVLHVNQRLLDLIMDARAKDIIDVEAPMMGRALQGLGSGMLKFQEACKFKDTPFPFPYIVVADALLMLHSIMTPFMMTQWSSTVWGCASFTFIVCTVTWSLHGIAEELDNPFNDRQNNLDGARVAEEFNRNILSLLTHTKLEPPTLSRKATTALPTAWARGSEMPMGRCLESLKKAIDMAAAESERSDRSLSQPRGSKDQYEYHLSHQGLEASQTTADALSCAIKVANEAANFQQGAFQSYQSSTEVFQQGELNAAIESYTSSYREDSLQNKRSQSALGGISKPVIPVGSAVCDIDVCDVEKGVDLDTAIGDTRRQHRV